MFAIDSNIPQLPEILSRSNFSTTIFQSGSITNQDLINTNTQYLFVRSTILVDKNLLKNTNIKFVSTATTGTDHIDLNYLKEKKIDFFAPLGSNSNSVAEYVITSILFSFKEDFSSLKDKLVGIVGYGNIGTKVAHYLHKMGIRYIICDPFVKKTTNSESSFFDLEHLISVSDIITFHVPLTTGGEHRTFDLLNKKMINLLKKNCIIINTSRGGVCNEIELLSKKDINFIIDT